MRILRQVKRDTNTMRIDVIVVSVVIVLICVLVAAERVFGVHYDDTQPGDMTTWVEMKKSQYGNWYFTNTSDKFIVCQIGLQSLPRWSTSRPPMSPALTKKDSLIKSTIGSRNFDLEPGQTYVYSRNDVGTLYCEEKRGWRPELNE